MESSEEVDLGVGRWYECVFCKRGFNTAQALGGHMNIHRKHSRPTNKPRFYHHMNIPPPSTTRPDQAAAAADESDRHPPHPSNRMRLSLLQDHVDKNRLHAIINQDDDDDKDLDLELRLGYD